MGAPGKALTVLAVAAFASLGLPDGVLGVAWPALRASVGAPVSRLGALLAVATAAYLASSAAAGPLAARLGVGRLLAASSAVMAASALAYAAAPAWGAVLLAGALGGLGAGAVDAAANAHAAARFSPRLVSWLHAAYGAGAAAGPLLLSALLAGGGSWRLGYLGIGGLLAALAAGFALTAGRWEDGAPPAAGAPVPPVRLRATLARPAAWPGLALFLVYAGLEVTAGQWSYTLLTEGRGVPPGEAGAWVSLYWAALTLGRVLCGALAARAAPAALVRLGLALAPVGAGLLWLDGGGRLGWLGLGVLGLALAPVYPLLVATTAARVGAAHAANAVGAQVAAAYLGAAGLPWAAGLAAAAHGLEVLGPILVGAALAALGLHEAAARGAPRAAPVRARPAAPPAA